MAHSNHARHVRYQDHATWFQKNAKHDSPAWDARRADLRVVAEGLDEVALAVHDPEVLLWGGALATVADLNRREKLREKTDALWVDYAEYDYDHYDPYYDDQYDPYRDYGYDDYQDDYDYWHADLHLDPCDAAWVEEWVAGREQTPDDWCDRSQEYDFAYCEEDDLYNPLIDYTEGGPDLPGDLAEVRSEERVQASTRGRRRSARRR